MLRAPTLYSIIALLLLAGCATAANRAGISPDNSTMPERFALPAAAHHIEERQEGSIYGGRSSVMLYEDSRAKNVGDILLVKIVETSSGSKKAETSTGRESTVTGGISSLFGIEQSIADKNRNFNPSATSLSATLTNDFDGTGETKRNSTVTATMSARVMEKTMNGHLVIRGYREVRVNNETQFMVLSGIIRPEDILPDNSVLSSYIADARIEYSGNGIISDKQQPGWLARALDVIWPF